MSAGVGKGRVRSSGSRELCIQLDDVPDVYNDQERRSPVGSRKGARITFGLGARAQQGVVVSARRATRPQLLRLQHEASTSVAVNAARAAGAIAVHKRDGALVHVVL